MRKPSTACKRYNLYGILEGRVISTELQYHFTHETLANMPACDSPCVNCTPHSPVVSLAMQLVIHDECLDSDDCLITLVDQCEDSEG